MGDSTVKLELIDGKAMLSGTARTNPEIIIDYSPPVGTGKGYNSLELFLMSFASCVGTTLVAALRRKLNKSINGISIEAEGKAREEHPKGLENILLKLHIKAKELSETEVRETLKALEDKLCPVWAMIKGNVTVTVEVEISDT